RQLSDMLLAERARLRQAEPAVRPGIELHIAFLEGQKAEAERAVGEAVRASEAWRERDDLLRSVPGVGPVLSSTLLAELPELGRREGDGACGALHGRALGDAVECAAPVVLRGAGRAG